MPDTDDLAVIRELLATAPPPPQVDDYVKGRLAAVMAAESHSGAERPARRRPRWRRGAAVMAAAGAAVAAVISVAVVPGTSRPGTAGGRPGVVQLLAKIAAAAGRQPVPRVRDSQFEYIKSREASYTLSGAAGPGSGRAPWHVHLTRARERQIWLPVSDLCRTGLIREGATTMRLALPQEPPGHGGKPPCPNRGYLDEPTYRLLQSLPTSPAALLHRIQASDNMQAGHPLRGAQADAAAFSTISDLVGESIVPPPLAAALYRVVALIPGIRIEPSAVDALGRHGVGVILQAGTIWGPTEMIFDRKTLQLTGTFTTTSRTRDLPAAFTAIQVRAFVNRPGQVPGR